MFDNDSESYRSYREANAYMKRDFDEWNKKENGVKIPLYGIASEQCCNVLEYFGILYDNRYVRRAVKRVKNYIRKIF